VVGNIGQSAHLKTVASVLDHGNSALPSSFWFPVSCRPPGLDFLKSEINTSWMASELFRLGIRL
jgi:hypothetical protein